MTPDEITRMRRRANKRNLRKSIELAFIVQSLKMNNLKMRLCFQKGMVFAKELCYARLKDLWSVMKTE